MSLGYVKIRGCMLECAPGGRIAGRSIFLALAAGTLLGWQQTGPQLIRQGKVEEALAVYRAEVEASPKSVAANNGAGVVLDLMGALRRGPALFYSGH
jgi:hypothetical protein